MADVLADQGVIETDGMQEGAKVEEKKKGIRQRRKKASWTVAHTVVVRRRIRERLLRRKGWREASHHSNLVPSLPLSVSHL